MTWPSTDMEALDSLLAAGPPPDDEGTPARSSARPDRRTRWTAAELLAINLPAPKWAVAGIIAEGVTILAGPPKVGKSWLAANIAVDVASASGKALGGIDVQSGDVLYLALEDTAGRLQSRLRKMLGDDKAPTRLHLATEWPPLDAGGIPDLDTWLNGHPTARLVVVDVLAKVRGAGRRNGNAYAEDYEVINQLKMVADRHQVAVLVVTHVRKMAAVDFLEQVSGTNGIAGAADCTIVLSRPRSETSGALNITGRDVEEATYAVVWRPEVGRWDLDGDGLAEASSAARRAEVSSGLGDRSVEILAYLDQHPEGVRAGQVAEHLGVAADNVRQPLRRLTDTGRINNPRRGLYTAVTSVTSVTSLGLTSGNMADQNVTPPSRVSRSSEPDVTPAGTNVTPTADSVTDIRPDQGLFVTVVTPVTGPPSDHEPPPAPTQCPICAQGTGWALVPSSAGPACRRCAPGIRAGTNCRDCGHPRDVVADGRCNPCHGQAIRGAA